MLSNITRTSYVTYYRQLKDLLCCDLTHTMERMWTSWTAAATSAGTPLSPTLVSAFRHFGGNIQAGARVGPARLRSSSTASPTCVAVTVVSACQGGVNCDNRSLYSGLMCRAAVLGLLLVWLFFCVKGGLGRNNAVKPPDAFMDVPDDVPAPKPSANEDYINNSLKDVETNAP